MPKARHRKRTRPSPLATAASSAPDENGSSASASAAPKEPKVGKKESEVTNLLDKLRSDKVEERIWASVSGSLHQAEEEELNACCSRLCLPSSSLCPPSLSAYSSPRTSSDFSSNAWLTPKTRSSLNASVLSGESSSPPLRESLELTPAHPQQPRRLEPSLRPLRNAQQAPTPTPHYDSPPPPPVPPSLSPRTRASTARRPSPLDTRTARSSRDPQLAEREAPAPLLGLE